MLYLFISVFSKNFNRLKHEFSSPEDHRFQLESPCDLTQMLVIFQSSQSFWHQSASSKVFYKTFLSFLPYFVLIQRMKTFLLKQQLTIHKSFLLQVASYFHIIRDLSECDKYLKKFSSVHIISDGLKSLVAYFFLDAVFLQLKEQIREKDLILLLPVVISYSIKFSTSLVVLIPQCKTPTHYLFLIYSQNSTQTNIFLDSRS